MKPSVSQLPLVSICIPTYNGEKFIDKTLSSAVGQTYPNLEIIVSDDGSTDKTLEIAKFFQEQCSIDFFILPHYQYGLVHNWNFCISKARGKYIKFLFQDDLLEPDCVKEMVNLAEQDEEIGLVFSHRAIILGEGAETDPGCMDIYIGGRDLHKAWSQLKPIQSGQALLADPNLLNAPINKIGEPTSVLIKKEVFDTIGLFDHELCQLIDVDMWLRIMGHYKIAFINKTLSYFRIHLQQQSRQNLKIGESLLDNHRLSYKILKEPIYGFLSQDLKEKMYSMLHILAGTHTDTTVKEKIKRVTSKSKDGINSARLFVTSVGNHFMLEIAQIFARGFRNNGVSVELAIDEIPSKTLEENLIQIVVAPHEFYPLFLEKKLSEAEIEKITQNVYLLNVEQPGSLWFEIAFKPSRHARGVFDINQQGVNEFIRRGVSALHTPLGYDSYFEAKTSNNSLSKPVDILFMGSHSPKREMFFSRNADFFSQYNCRVILTRVDQPNLTHTPGFYAGQERNQLLSDSKIIINIHFADRNYFEWHRVLMAVANQCLVVSETSDYTDPLLNGKHLVLTQFDNITSVCKDYLERKSERVKLTKQAYQLVTESYTAGIVCKKLIDKLNSWYY